MTSPTPAHDFGLLAGELAWNLNDAITRLHRSHAEHDETAAECTHLLCYEAARAVASAEKVASRSVDDPDFVVQLAGYADGIATCVLRHETAADDRTTLVLTATERTLRTAANWLESDKDSEMLTSAADAVKAQGADELCCPVCEEIECDGDCPLAELRAVRHD